MKTFKISCGILVSCMIFTVLSFAKDKADLPQTKSSIKATFVELGSVNCIPCKAMQPVMKDIETEYGDQIKVIFYDVWTKEGSPYGKQYKIQAIPTQVFLDKDGKEYFRHFGFFPKDEIVKVLEKQGVKQSLNSAKPADKTDKAGSNLQSGAVCK
jgi:thioredoxin 1